MTKFMNAPATALADSFEGFSLAHEDLVDVYSEPRFVCRRSPRREKVAVVSGGGAGHDPLHAGFVGLGMLDAAVPGEIFTSPSPSQVLAAIEAVAGDMGVLLIVKNYAGDVMNFEMAMDMYGGIAEMVVIEDDVAVGEVGEGVGRRGVAGTMIVEKIVGAAAEQGADLRVCAALAREVAHATRSMGVALGGCTIPGADRPNLELGSGEMEVGVGIHGEPGLRRAPAVSACEIVGELAPLIVNELGSPDEVLLLVNGFGGTAPLELYILYKEMHRYLTSAGVAIGRSMVGNYVTSLEMPGASLTVTHLSKRFRSLWDAPVNTPGLRWGI